ncbi:MAG TPA: diphosphomevalonate decarboxylase [Thermoanaerobaculia bacterium]|nr:diphosphomevalonate decarboxylase [Thermoanaerobaculia bacterium]
MSKTTVDAPANIAFIKYWGAKDLERAIPQNPSISMTLETCRTRCTAEILEETSASARSAGSGPAPHDEVWLSEADGSFRKPPPEFDLRVRAHLDRIRRWAGSRSSFRIATRNGFPTGGGLASSASGFAALTLAAAGALDKGGVGSRELSRLARESGSGSAARSVLGGYVEWPAGEARDEQDSYAVQLAPAESWDLRDVIAVVEIGPKVVSSLEGHRRAPTSPYFSRRLELLPARLERVRQAIESRDLALLGPVLEEEAVDLHLIAMSSSPPIFYWSPGTVGVLRAVRELRQEGLAAYATMDAGANVHVICEPEAEDEVAGRLDDLPVVGFVLRDGVGEGPEIGIQHLF